MRENYGMMSDNDFRKPKHRHHHCEKHVWIPIASVMVAAVATVAIVVIIRRKKIFAQQSSSASSGNLQALFHTSHASSHPAVSSAAPKPAVTSYDHFVGKQWDSENILNYYSSAGTPAECSAECNADSQCAGFNFNAAIQNRCQLRHLKQAAGWTSGIRRINGTFAVLLNALIDQKYNTISAQANLNASTCANACNANTSCDAFSLNTHTGMCYLKQFPTVAGYDIYLKP